MTSSSCACAKTKRLEARGNHEPQMVLHQDPQRGRHDEKENAPTPGTDAALYEAVKNKIAEEVPEAKIILNQLPQASGTKGTKEITPEDAKKSRTPPKKCRQSWKNRLPAKSSAPYWNIRMNCRQRPSSSLKSPERKQHQGNRGPAETKRDPPGMGEQNPDLGHQ